MITTAITVLGNVDLAYKVSDAVLQKYYQLNCIVQDTMTAPVQHWPLTVGTWMQSAVQQCTATGQTLTLIIADNPTGLISGGQ